MEKLHFPAFGFRFKDKENKRYIWDIARRRYVRLTPEEWVRQHVIHFLSGVKKYPLPLMGVEKKLTVNGMSRRTDLVVFDRRMKPQIIVECKAPGVAVSQKVFDQIARYNMALHARYLMLTNGRQHYFCRMDFEEETYVFLPDIPDYQKEKS